MDWKLLAIAIGEVVGAAVFIIGGFLGVAYVINQLPPYMMVAIVVSIIPIAMIGFLVSIRYDNLLKKKNRIPLHPRADKYK